MADLDKRNGSYEIAFEAFGVRVLLSASGAEELDRLSAILPPGWQPCPPAATERHYALIADEAGGYSVRKDENTPTAGLSLDLALVLVDSKLRGYIALTAPDRIFVHAGVVSYDGRSIVIPGLSFAGKTTLVAEFVRAGAIYYSDEFAVLDADGLVHPYTKPLSLRGDDEVQTDHHVAGLGGIAGEEPLPIGTVVVTTYRPGAEWRPRRLSSGEGVLALLSHTVPARERPRQALATITRAVDGALLLESERGEAEEVVPSLLAELGR